MARVELSRSYAVVAVVASLCAAFAAIDLSLRATFGMLPESLLRIEYLGPDKLAQLGGRVVAVEAARPAKPLAVVLGFSTAREAFVPRLLEAAQPSGVSRQWLNLGGSGSSFYELDYYFRPLLRSEVNAELVVIGVHPVWMAGKVSNPKLIHAGVTDVLSALAGGRLRVAKQELMEWSFLQLNRNRISLSLALALAASREWVLLGLKLPQSLLYPPAANPWLEERRYQGHSDEKWRSVQMASWERFHWFEREHYRDRRDEASNALEVIRDCQRFAKRVVIVYMPEGSVFRARIPAEAEASFQREVLARLEPRPRVIDLRDALPDSAFFDQVHVNETGRPLASALLVQRLAALK